MNSRSIFLLFTIQPPLRKLIGSILILDAIQMHLIEQHSDRDLTLNPMQIGNSKCKYLMIYLYRSTSPIAIQRKIGEIPLIKQSILEPINKEMKQSLIQLHLVLLVYDISLLLSPITLRYFSLILLVLSLSQLNITKKERGVTVREDIENING